VPGRQLLALAKPTPSYAIGVRRGPPLAVREVPASVASKPRLLDRVRAAVRARHYSRRTEKAYVAWIRRYILYHGKRHPLDMGGPEASKFLTSLAMDGHVAGSTQNQALSALLFLYREGLEQKLPWLDDVVRAKRSIRLPVVLTGDQVRAVICCLCGTQRLVTILLYGSGLRLLEAHRLRAKDLDFARNQITVRAGKGDKDQAVPLPAVAIAALHAHLEHTRRQHERDLIVRRTRGCHSRSDLRASDLLEDRLARCG